MRPSDDAGALGPRSPRFTPRTPSPRRWPLVLVALVVIALVGVVVSSLLGMRSSFLFGASPTATATAHPTVTPEPTVFSIPLGAVQPALDLPGSARLGGTVDGFTKAFGSQFDPANFSDQWQWHIGGQPAWIRVEPVTPAEAADGQAHVGGFLITASQYPPITGSWDSTSAEAFVLALLPPDTTYIGDKVGASGVKCMSITAPCSRPSSPRTQDLRGRQHRAADRSRHGRLGLLGERDRASEGVQYRDVRACLAWQGRARDL